jgi:hypothetical protein
MADPWGLVSKRVRGSSGPFSHLTFFLQNATFCKVGDAGFEPATPPCKLGQCFPGRYCPVGKTALLSGFWRFLRHRFPALFGCVLLRLQHGCSTLCDRPGSSAYRPLGIRACPQRSLLGTYQIVFSANRYRCSRKSSRILLIQKFSSSILSSCRIRANRKALRAGGFGRVEEHLVVGADVVGAPLAGSGMTLPVSRESRAPRPRLYTRLYREA